MFWKKVKQEKKMVKRYFPEKEIVKTLTLADEYFEKKTSLAKYNFWKHVFKVFPDLQSGVGYNYDVESSIKPYIEYEVTE